MAFEPIERSPQHVSFLANVAVGDSQEHYLQRLNCWSGFTFDLISVVVGVTILTSALLWAVAKPDPHVAAIDMSQRFSSMSQSAASFEEEEPADR